MSVAPTSRKAAAAGLQGRLPPRRAGTGTGAAIRPDTVRRYAEQAGFASCRIADIEHMLFRFHVLRTPG